MRNLNLKITHAEQEGLGLRTANDDLTRDIRSKYDDNIIFLLLLSVNAITAYKWLQPTWWLKSGKYVNFVASVELSLVQMLPYNVLNAGLKIFFMSRAILLLSTWWE